MDFTLQEWQEIRKIMVIQNNTMDKFKNNGWKEEVTSSYKAKSILGRFHTKKKKLPFLFYFPFYSPNKYEMKVCFKLIF